MLEIERSMKCNIGKKNRYMRGVLGLILLIASLIVFRLNFPISFVLGILGIVMISEAYFGYCVIHGIHKSKDMR